MTALSAWAPPTLSVLPRLTPEAAAAVSVTPTELVRRWLANLSPTARRSYARALRGLAGWALAEHDAEPERALALLVDAGCGPAHELVARWRDSLLQSGLSTGTVACAITGVASLVGALRRAGIVSWRLEGVSPRYERRQDRSGPRRFEVEQILATIDEAADRGHVRACRDAAILRLSYVAALRRSEALQLRWPEDVDLDAGIVRPRRKGKRERQDVLVTGRCIDAIRRWLAARSEQPGPLFVAHHDLHAPTPLSGEAWRSCLATWARRAGVQRAVRPHGLRHSSASEVASRGSLANLMALGQWSSMSAARRYLDDRLEERRAALALVDL